MRSRRCAASAGGWTYVPTQVLVARLADVLGDRPVPEGVRVQEELTDAWLATYARSRPLPADRTVVERILTSHPPRAFAAMVDDTTPVAIGRGHISGPWLGVAAVWVDPDHRRAGRATAIMTALGHWAARQAAATPTSRWTGRTRRRPLPTSGSASGSTTATSAYRRPPRGSGDSPVARYALDLVCGGVAPVEVLPLDHRAVPVEEAGVADVEPLHRRLRLAVRRVVLDVATGGEVGPAGFGGHDLVVGLGRPHPDRDRALAARCAVHPERLDQHPVLGVVLEAHVEARPGDRRLASGRVAVDVERVRPVLDVLEPGEEQR